MKYKVFKMQIALAGTGGDVLVYSKGKSDMMFFSETQEILNLMGGDVKSYFLGYIKNGTLFIEERVGDQDW